MRENVLRGTTPRFDNRMGPRALALACAALLLAGSLPAFAAVAVAAPPAPKAMPVDDVVGELYEVTGVSAAEAQEIFAGAGAALWVEARGQVLWMETGPAPARAIRSSGRQRIGTTTSGSFRQLVEADLPALRTGAAGGWLLKLPSRLDKGAMAGTVPAPAAASAGSAPAAIAGPLATVFNDGFESGLGNWVLAMDTPGYSLNCGPSAPCYQWGATTCDKHSGSYSADAFRGGATTMTCTEEYPKTFEIWTDMEHKTCENIAGASEAWLDFWFRTGIDASDYLGIYYSMPDPAAPTKLLYFGYSFSGSISSWWRIVENLKQWTVIGDLTKTSCPKVDFFFWGDGTSQSGTNLFGARVDDVTVRTDAPTFFRVSASATPTSGAAPLTVSFRATVSGATSPSYLWQFDDAAGTTSTSANPSFTYTKNGTYYASVWVVDSGSTSAGHATITITVGGSGGCTVTPCSVTVPATAQVGVPIQVTATASTSGCTGTPQYFWQFGETTARIPGQNLTYTYQTAGTWPWVMSVEVDGKQCLQNGTITVGGSTTCPTISILQVDPASCPNVKVITSVRDANGNPVTGLTTSNFCVNEDSSPQQITVKPVGSSGSNLAVAVVIDNTGSVGSASFADEKNAAKALVQLLAAGDQGAAYGFSAPNINLVKDFTTDKAALAAAIDAYPYSGGNTNYYDAVYAALGNTATRTGRKAVVALTDGDDNSGTIAPTPAERMTKVIAYAKQLGIPIFTIAFGSSVQTAALQQVARETGGLFFASATSANLQQILQAIGQVLNGAYEVSYTTSRVDGQSHALEVCVISGSCRQTATGTVKCGNTPPPTCAATRTLSGGYMAGQAFPVVIAVNPPAGSFSHALEDAPPTGWTVSAIDNGGTWDGATGKVKWGPYFDTTTRVLHYSVTPPAGTTGTKTFAGVLSVDGVSQAICGDSSISAGSNYHPADTNRNNRIVVDEVTAYGAAWKSGATWPNPPLPIPIDYVTNAGYIWKSGEAYHYSASDNPPFVPGASPVAPKLPPDTLGQSRPEPLGGGTSTASFSSTGYTAGVGLTVSLDSRPQAGTQAWAAEDTPPTGWTVTSISHSGAYDTTNAKVKYGPFFDSTARVLTYVATPPAGTSGTKNFAGRASFDGTGVVIGGNRTISPGGGDPTKLPLQGGKVSVGITFRNPYSGATGTGSAIPKDDQYGFFYFSDANNPEVFVKVLDFGPSRPYLLFWAGLTDFEYTVKFTNTATGASYSYKKDAYLTAGGADTTNLPHSRAVLWDPRTNTAEVVPEGVPILQAMGVDLSSRLVVTRVEPTYASIESREGRPGPAAATEILLAGKQVAVSATWKSGYAPFASGDAVPIPQQDEFCFFYFSDPANPEVFVKVLDWGGPFKIFAAGLTDFEYTVTYRSVKSGSTLVFKKDAFKFDGYANNLTR